jgi:hypothetical protein
MKIIHESAFISEIIFQTKIALHAFEKLDNINELDHISIWSSLQTILISSSNISKILWPVEKYMDRGTHLRNLLKIDEDNALKARKFRNRFEHYDEKIDKVFRKNNISSYVDFAMNPSLNTFTNNLCHRGYNSYNSTLIVHGEVLDLTKLISAIKQIKNDCENLFLKPI